MSNIVSTKSPMRMLGAQPNSGSPNTGEFPHVRGGSLKAVVWSGSLLTNAAFGGVPGGVSSGGHIQIASGAGRINSVLPHQAMQSGLPVFFYDASAVTLSGVSVSGQNILGVLPGIHQAYFIAGFQSGGQNPPWSWSYLMDVVFFSGLCAAIPSGTPGFTVTYTPDTSPNFG